MTTAQPDLFGKEAPGAPLTAGMAVVVRSHVRHVAQRQEAKKKRLPKRPRITLAERFTKYHAANPRVYTSLVAMARELKGKGIQHYGIAALWEVLRYRSLTTTDTDGLPFKLSNNHRAYYARLINTQEPDLADFFTTRATRS